MKIQIRKTLSEDMKAPYYKRVKSIHEKNKKILIGFGVGANENRGPFKTDKSMGKKGESAPPGAAGGGSLEETVISEGGNVFKDKEGNISTKRISRSDVKPTVKWLEGITGLSLLDNLLGTGGIAETSGDLDLAVNDAETTKAELESKLKQSFPAQYVVKTGNSVHFKTPILGDESNGFVQTDFMFGDPTWLKFAMRGGKPGSVYKGFHKHLLLASIAKAQGYKWSYLNGLVDRATNKIISKDADQIAKTILGQGKTEKDMYDVESVIDAIKDRPDYEELVQQARGDFEREGVKFPETKTPEKLTEAKEGPRIQHAEDVVFWEGSKGANRVLDLLSSLASDKGKSSTTIKWDGSPAIIFGRDENGQFIFTDKSGFTAKGYDGKAKSPKQLKDILINTRRVSKGLSVDQGYQDFANKMADAFTIFEKALPQSYRGYFFGDLLYLNTPSIVDGKYQFKPNIVTYKVDPKSEIGKRIGKSKAGVVVHREIDFEDNKTPVQNYNIFQGSDLLVVPPVTVQAPVKIDTKSIASLKSKVNSNASKIDDLLDEQKLRSMKLTAFPDLLYAYLNSKVDTGLTDLGKDFIQWLNSKQSITATAKENVKKYISENSESFDILWQIVDGVMNVKNNIIHQLDAQDAPIKSSIGDVGVGEGYVMADPRGDIKLVDRTVFSKANRSIVRENQEPKQPANTVVLFAGSFKPPHKGHIGLINEVSHLPGVEKIVVLISDPVQETSIRTKDFGAKEVKLIFEIYARAFDFGCSVDFEVSNAPSSMSAAYKYLETERFQPNTKVLFATSKADSGRYPQAKLDKSALKNASNPTAGSIELPEMIDPDTSKKFSATNMREILADPNSDKQLLKKYMPENLPEKDKQLVIDMLTKSSRHEQADKMMNEILSELLNLIVEKKEMICDGSQCETTHKGMSHDEYSIFQEKKDRCYQIAKRKYKAFPSAYASGAIVKCRQGKIWKSVKEEGQELEEEWSEKYKKSIDCKNPKGFSQRAHCQGKKKNESIELEERKLGKPSSETNLGDWFKRKGAPGKKGGWVDCNTCRDGKCKPCGRQEGEKRSKYPRCRPTPSQCKGYKRRGSNLQKD